MNAIETANAYQEQFEEAWEKLRSAQLELADFGKAILDAYYRKEGLSRVTTGVYVLEFQANDNEIWSGEHDSVCVERVKQTLSQLQDTLNVNIISLWTAERGWVYFEVRSCE